jgi:tetratricopeptide (TPR) repeat protein
VVDVVVFVVVSLIVVALPLWLALEYGRPRNGLSRAQGRRVNARIDAALALAAAGELPRAVADSEAVAAELKLDLGPDHPDTLAVRSVVAGLHLADGNTEMARSDYEEVVAAVERTFGPQHRNARNARVCLAAARWDGGDRDGAVELLRAVVTATEEDVGPDHADTLDARFELALTLLAWGAPDEANALLDELVATTERLAGPTGAEATHARAAREEARRTAADPDAYAAYVRHEATRTHPQVTLGRRPPPAGTARTWTWEVGLTTPAGSATWRHRRP